MNDCLGRMGAVSTETKGASHTLSCDVPDRDSKEVRQLQEAVDMIEDFQRRGARREVLACEG